MMHRKALRQKVIKKLRDLQANQLSYDNITLVLDPNQPNYEEIKDLYQPLIINIKKANTSHTNKSKTTYED